MNPEFKSGFIGLVGPTNSGKSTLMNALVGHKVSIVSPKVQTTYHGIHGIKNEENAQIIFTDTPGFQKHRDRVAQLLNRVAENHAKESDVLVWVFDASNPRVLSQISRMSKKIEQLKPKSQRFLVLNKVDKVNKLSLLPLIEEIHRLELFSDIVPISARKKDGIEKLLALVGKEMPQGDKLYPEEAVTDRPKEFLISELVRERIYAAAHQEIPYSVRVTVEEWTEHPDEQKKLPTIRAVIHVDSRSKRPILIGKGGEMLKRIGTEARKEVETLLGHQVCLKLHVDVEEAWKTDRREVSQYLELNA